MATATQTPPSRRRLKPDAAAAGVTPETPVALGGVDQRREYRCDCGHALRVSGGGRHRVYFQLDDARLDDPVMNRICPECGRGLPGKNQP